MSNTPNVISVGKMEDDGKPAMQCEEESVLDVTSSEASVVAHTPGDTSSENRNISDETMEGASCQSERSDSPDIEIIGTYKCSGTSACLGPKATETKILKRLEYNNPKFMKDFDPERSQREARKLEKLPVTVVEEVTPKRNRNRKYDAKGLLIGTGEDLCDCLMDDCPGCHFPCPKCRSCKCGHACRRNRLWVYEEIEIEGTGEIITRKYKKEKT